MTYANMTAVELHDLVTRLEAHGFVLPEGLALSKNVWGNMWVLYSETPVDEQFAAAIIEVAARDWWIGKGVLPKEASGADEDIDWHWNIDIERTKATAWRPRFGGKSGPTPLHAIVAAVEAKEAK